MVNRDDTVVNRDDTVVNRDDTVVNRDDTVVNRDDTVVNRDDTVVNRDDTVVNRDDTVVNRDDTVVNRDDTVVNRDRNQEESTDFFTYSRREINAITTAATSQRPSGEEMMAKQQILIEGFMHQQQELAKSQEELHQHDP